MMTKFENNLKQKIRRLVKVITEQQLNKTFSYLYSIWTNDNLQVFLYIQVDLILYSLEEFGYFFS